MAAWILTNFKRCKNNIYDNRQKQETASEQQREVYTGTSQNTRISNSGEKNL